MAYTVSLTNGVTLFDLPDQTIDTTHTSLSLVGRGATNYGTAFADNFVGLIENFANNSAPRAPLTGQLWYDTVAKYLKIYDSGTWSAIVTSGGGGGGTTGKGVMFGGTGAPPNSFGSQGDYYFDSTANSIYAKGETAWSITTTVAPIASPAFTGTPTAPTPAGGDSSTKIATTAFVTTTISTGGYVTKAYVDAGDANAVATAEDYANTHFLPLSGGTLSGGVVVSPSGSGISKLVGGTSSAPGAVVFTATDGTDRGFIGWGDGSYLHIGAQNGCSGYLVYGGALTVDRNPTAAMQVATKQYVDGAISGAGAVHATASEIYGGTTATKVIDPQNLKSALDSGMMDYRYIRNYAAYPYATASTPTYQTFSASVHTKGDIIDDNTYSSVDATIDTSANTITILTTGKYLLNFVANVRTTVSAQTYLVAAAQVYLNAPTDASSGQLILMDSWTSTNGASEPGHNMHASQFVNLAAGDVLTIWYITYGDSITQCSAAAILQLGRVS